MRLVFEEQDEELYVSDSKQAGGTEVTSWIQGGERVVVQGSVPGLDAAAHTSYVRADAPADGWVQTHEIPDLESEETTVRVR